MTDLLFKIGITIAAFGLFSSMFCGLILNIHPGYGLAVSFLGFSFMTTAMLTMMWRDKP